MEILKSRFNVDYFLAAESGYGPLGYVFEFLVF